MRIKRSEPSLVELFATLLPDSGGQARTMFGCPCGFIGGNMFTGLFEDKLFVRLAEEDRAVLLAKEGAELFDPMGGRPMREYVVVPSPWLEGESDDELRAWMAKAAGYARTLPAKVRRRTAKRPAAKKTAASKKRRTG
jgi:TfoX/Sxy family transcriptional regulator of competence genes